MSMTYMSITKLTGLCKNVAFTTSISVKCVALGLFFTCSASIYAEDGGLRFSERLMSSAQLVKQPENTDQRIQVTEATQETSVQISVEVVADQASLNAQND